MPKLYPLKYEKFYNKLGRITHLNNEELDVLMLKMISVIKNDLKRSGEVYVPYMGKFTLKRMAPRKRSMLDFGNSQRYTVKIPAQDKLSFRVNRAFAKLFR